MLNAAHFVSSCCCLTYELKLYVTVTASVREVLMFCASCLRMATKLIQGSFSVPTEILWQQTNSGTVVVAGDKIGTFDRFDKDGMYTARPLYAPASGQLVWFDCPRRVAGESEISFGKIENADDSF